MTAQLGDPLALLRGPSWNNRFMLAPLTNQQSHADGRLSEDEYRWLTMRAKGGFGLTMTCAAHVQAVGQGFPGQLGIFDDTHLDGLRRLADGIRAHGSVSSVQLHHAGIRADKGLVPAPVGASDDVATNGRALTLDEVERLRDDFIAGARRAEAAGFDGVEVHGAHGYVLAQFLSASVNQRTDRYGGGLENRARLLFEVVDGIRAACRPDFQLGLRLSPERFGLKLGEIKDVAAEMCRRGAIDYLDLSLWEVFKHPEDAEHQDRTLLQHFTHLDRGDVRLGGAGKVATARDAACLLDAGCDFAVIGRGAILQHDFATRALEDADFSPPPLPVTDRHLAEQGVGGPFLEYLGNWPGFVERTGA